VLQWARLQEVLNPINETAGFLRTLPTDFKEYVTNVFLPPLLSKTGRNLATRVANGSFACPKLEF
jgi:hypothetical protein